MVMVKDYEICITKQIEDARLPILEVAKYRCFLKQTGVTSAFNVFVKMRSISGNYIQQQLFCMDTQPDIATIVFQHLAINSMLIHFTEN